MKKLDYFGIFLVTLYGLYVGVATLLSVVVIPVACVVCLYYLCCGR